MRIRRMQHRVVHECRRQVDQNPGDGGKAIDPAASYIHPRPDFAGRRASGKSDYQILYGSETDTCVGPPWARDSTARAPRYDRQSPTMEPRKAHGMTAKGLLAGSQQVAKTVASKDA